MYLIQAVNLLLSLLICCFNSERVFFLIHTWVFSATGIIIQLFSIIATQMAWFYVVVLYLVSLDMLLSIKISRCLHSILLLAFFSPPFLPTLEASTVRLEQQCGIQFPVMGTGCCCRSLRTKKHVCSLHSCHTELKHPQASLMFL